MPKKTPPLSLLLLLAAYLLSSCGGSRTEGPASPPEADQVSDTGASGAGTTQPTDDASIEAYCSKKAESDALFDEADPFDPATVEAAFRGTVSIIDAALQTIPAEIESDLRVVRQSMDDYIDVLEANDWDFFAASSAMEEIEGPELEAAEARLETWEETNCDFPDDEDDFEDVLREDPFSTPEAFEAMLSSDAGRAMIIEGMTEDGELTADQAECMLDNLDIELLSALATGAEPSPESLTPFFEIAVLCDLDETSIFGDEDWSEDLDDADVDLTPELVEAMLGTEAGRAMFIEGMTEDGELTVDQAECMLDNLDFVALAGISSGDEPDPEIVSALFNVAATCAFGKEFLAD